MPLLEKESAMVAFLCERGGSRTRLFCSPKRGTAIVGEPREDHVVIRRHVYVSRTQRTPGARVRQADFPSRPPHNIILLVSRLSAEVTAMKFLAHALLLCIAAWHSASIAVGQ